MSTDRRVALLVEALGDPDRVRCVRAPGRVNLMGDHTDYNDGFVLPMAIDRDCVVAARPRADDRVTVRSLELDGTVDVASDGATDPSDVEPRWGRFAAGVVRALAGRGRVPVGLDAAVSSTVPVGSGLSSSTALTVALALALADAAGLTLPPVELAVACLEAEVMATGVPGGLMDQLVSLLGRAGHALLIDCRTLDADPVPVPDGLAVLVAHSGLPRTLVDSEYASRRAACEAAAAALGVPALRDATLEQVRDDPIARHVVTENQRVLRTAEALRADDRAALAPLLLASHASLRDDYKVSTPELDALVDALVTAGALGARLTGAGFGGCVVALAQRNHADDVAAKAVGRYRAETGLESAAFTARAVRGAGTLRPGEAT